MCFRAASDWTVKGKSRDAACAIATYSRCRYGLRLSKLHRLCVDAPGICYVDEHQKQLQSRGAVQAPYLPRTCQHVYKLCRSVQAVSSSMSSMPLLISQKYVRVEARLKPLTHYIQGPTGMGASRRMAPFFTCLTDKGASWMESTLTVLPSILTTDR